MKQRHGIAIITVVLLSALILIAITIVSAQAIAEKTMTTSQNAYKRALSVAEAGLTETITNLRNAQWTGSVLMIPAGSYVTNSMMTGVNGVAGLTDGGLGTIVVGAVKVWPDSTSTFQVKIKKLDGATVNTSSSSSQLATIRVGVYVMGEVYTNGTRAVSGLMARRVLYAEYNVTFNMTPTIEHTFNGLFDYGLLSGGAMNFTGDAVVYGGSIRANEPIDVGNKQRLFNSDGSANSGYVYKAYTSAITGGVQGTANSSSWVDPSKGTFNFPTISMDFYEGLANNFKGGGGFYSASADPNNPNGSGDPANPTIMYPNTSNTMVQQLIVADLGAVGTPSTFAQVMTFYNHLMNRTGGIPSVPLGWQSVPNAVYNQIKSNLPRATYYINGSTGIGNGTASGTVVFDCPPGGGITFNGGELDTAGGLALLVNGDLFINGNTTVYGGIYATGKIQQFNGSFVVYGSVATKGTMDKLAGSLDVHYVLVSGIPAVVGDVPGIGVNGIIQTVEPFKDPTNGNWDWSEKDLNAFTTP